jgi:hypothetical protein
MNVKKNKRGERFYSQWLTFPALWENRHPLLPLAPKPTAFPLPPLLLPDTAIFFVLQKRLMAHKKIG